MLSRLATERGLWSDAYREFLRPRTVAVAIVSVVLFTVAMTIFGPLGTLEALRPFSRAAYWGLCAGITFPLTYSVAAVALYLTRHRSLVEIVAVATAAVLFEGLLCTAIVLAAHMLLVPANAPPLSPGISYLTVTVVVAVCTFFAHYVVFQRVSQAQTAADARGSSLGAELRSSRLAAASGSGTALAGGAGTPATIASGDSQRPRSGSARGTVVPFRPPDDSAAGRVPGTTEPRARTTQPASERSADRRQLTVQQARFHDRLSRAVSRDIIYLRADDHYVHVYTTGGSCLVRKRMASAVAELGALGMQVHRSYWVAHRHMLITVRSGGRPVLRVTGGQKVPISRPYLAAVRDALRTQSSRPPGGEQVT